LSIARVGHRSVVSHCFASSPLRILTPRNHGLACWTYTSTLGGGLVDGDWIRLDLDVCRGAAAVLSTQGETRVYRSPRGCRNDLTARLAPNSLLAVLPDPTACFADAVYTQSTEITLPASAALVWVDSLVAGRSARGERWAFRRYEANVSVAVGARQILQETLLLDPAHGPLADRFGRFEVLATVLLAGDPLRSVRAALAQELNALPISPLARRLESANVLGEEALLVRLAGVSVEEVLRRIQAHLSFLPQILGDDPWSRRN
jgi:urease accessory protein